MLVESRCLANCLLSAALLAGKEIRRQVLCSSSELLLELSEEDDELEEQELELSDCSCSLMVGVLDMVDMVIVLRADMFMELRLDKELRLDMAALA